jgi:hypothetical protein
VIFDAQYSLADAISVKEDWGHSSNVVGVEMCQLARARPLPLTTSRSSTTSACRLLAETRRLEEITGPITRGGLGRLRRPGDALSASVARPTGCTGAPRWRTAVAARPAAARPRGAGALRLVRRGASGWRRGCASRAPWSSSPSTESLHATGNGPGRGRLAHLVARPRGQPAAIGLDIPCRPDRFPGSTAPARQGRRKPARRLRCLQRHGAARCSAAPMVRRGRVEGRPGRPPPALAQAGLRRRSAGFCAVRGALRNRTRSTGRSTPAQRARQAWSAPAAPGLGRDVRPPWHEMCGGRGVRALGWREMGASSVGGRPSPPSPTAGVAAYAAMIGALRLGRRRARGRVERDLREPLCCQGDGVGLSDYRATRRRRMAASRSAQFLGHGGRRALGPPRALVRIGCWSPEPSCCDRVAAARQDVGALSHCSGRSRMGFSSIWRFCWTRPPAWPSALFTVMLA